MPFESAELKQLAERAWAEGIPLSASQAGHYFYYEQLATLVDQAIDIARDRRFAIDTYQSTLASITLLRRNPLADPMLLAHDIAMRDLNYQYYQDTSAAIDATFTRRYEVQALQDIVTDLSARLNELLYMVSDFEAEIQDALDDQEWAGYMMDVYADTVDYYESDLYYLRSDWEDCLDEEEEEPWRCEDMEEEFRDTEAAFDRAVENYDDADERYAYYRRLAYDLQWELDSFDETVDDTRDQYLAALDDLRALQAAAPDTTQLYIDLDYYYGLYQEWQQRLFFHEGALATITEQLAALYIRRDHSKILMDASMFAYEAMIDRWWTG